MRSRVLRRSRACPGPRLRPPGRALRRSRGCRRSSRRSGSVRCVQRVGLVARRRRPGPSPPLGSRPTSRGVRPVRRSYAWLFAWLTTSTPARRAAGSAPGSHRSGNALATESTTSVAGHSRFTTVRSSRRKIPPSPLQAQPYPRVPNAGICEGSRLTSPVPWITRVPLARCACRARARSPKRPCRRRGRALRSPPPSIATPSDRDPSSHPWIHPRLSQQPATATSCRMPSMAPPTTETS